MNIYGNIEEDGKSQMFIGQPLPKNLTFASASNHYMTVDKIIGHGNFDINLDPNAANSELRQLDIKQQLSKTDIKIKPFKKHENVCISDFDSFMPRGNPIFCYK